MKKSEHLEFSEEIKSKWFVRRDSCYDQYIVLNGKKALGNGGLDHIYLISKDRAGYWVTSDRISRSITSLQKKVPSIEVEQLGTGEAVLSLPVSDLDRLCRVIRAKKHKVVSDEHLKKLRAGQREYRSKS